MLTKHPEKRFSSEEALTHPWFKEKKAPPVKKTTKEETIYSCYTNGFSDQHSPWENMEIFMER
jgi:serine/threonine protein kinase